MDTPDFVGVKHYRPDWKELHHAEVYCPDEIRYSTERWLGGATVVPAEWSLKGLEPLMLYKIVIARNVFQMCSAMK